MPSYLDYVLGNTPDIEVESELGISRLLGIEDDQNPIYVDLENLIPRPSSSSDSKLTLTRMMTELKGIGAQGTSVQGTQGIQGLQGIQGVQGTQGEQGFPGRNSTEYPRHYTHSFNDIKNTFGVIGLPLNGANPIDNRNYPWYYQRIEDITVKFTAGLTAQSYSTF